IHDADRRWSYEDHENARENEQDQREDQLHPVLAAFSSAICFRRVRIESDWTRSAWAILEPNRSAWMRMAARLRTSSTPVRTPRSCKTSRRGRPICNWKFASDSSSAMTLAWSFISSHTF